MTRAELRDYLYSLNCEFIPLSEHTTGNSIKVVNTTNNKHAFINLPFDDRIIGKNTLCQICMQLSVPIPDHGKSSIGLAEKIKEKHYPDGKPRFTGKIDP